MSASVLSAFLTPIHRESYRFAAATAILFFPAERLG
jgi:hypothetical protein